MARGEQTDHDVAMDAATKTVAGERQLELRQKLNKIMESLGDIQPDGFNKHFRYPFYSDKALSGKFRGLFTRFGLVIIPAVQDYDIREGRTNAGGSTWLTTLKVEFTILDTESGHVITGQGVGQGDDPGDKGANKAMTAALKFFLMKVFSIGGEADPEEDESTDERASGDSRGRPRSDDDRDRGRNRDRDRDDRDRPRDRDERPRGRDDRDAPRRDDRDDRDDRRRGEDREPVRIEDSNIEGIQRGGRANYATEAQLTEIRSLARDLDWKPADVVAEMKRLDLDEIELDEDAAVAGPQLVRALEALRSTEIGELLDSMGKLADRKRERARGDD